MTIHGSVDITNLEVEARFDISGINPVIYLTNKSTGSGLANMTWWFVITTPSGSYIHQGLETAPDITGNWSNHTITDGWPKPFGQIEWSGAPYVINVYAKDSGGLVHGPLNKIATICRPSGNTELSKNAYGLANTLVQVRCDLARVFFQDQTNHSYKGIEGSQVSALLKVIYPLDETHSLPEAFQTNYFSSALVPITYSSDNYQFLAESVYDYDLGDSVVVRIKYRQVERFPVYCNIDLGILACEIEKLIYNVQQGNCADMTDAHNKLALINSKFSLALIGTMQPLTGIDVPKIVQEIQTIGEFTCNCCGVATGIIPQNASNVDGYTFQIVPEGGDINGTVVATGTLIQFRLRDVKYIFKICSTSPINTSAFSVTPSVSSDGFTKTYCLGIDVGQFASDLATYITTNAGLVNLWNNIFNNSTNPMLVVDGKCIFQSSATCDYTFTLFNIPLNTTFALLSSIKIGEDNIALSHSFNLTTLGALQTYLNTLGYGAFVVSSPGGQTVLITSNNNGNEIVNVKYKISSTVYVADMTKQCEGFIELDASLVVQKIVNYLCSLDDSQLVTSEEYQVCYVDEDGKKQTVVVAAGQPLLNLLSEITARGCQTIDYILSVSATGSCTGIKSLFEVNTKVITSTDSMLGTKGNGVCSQVSYLEAFRYMLQAGITNATVKQLFCDFVVSCGQGLTCAPYDFMEVIKTTYDSACTEIVGIEYTLL